MILAKKYENQFQSLEEHTFEVLREAFNLIDEKLEVVSKISGFSMEKIKDLIFFSVYFHDIGKATFEFQETIKNNAKIENTSLANVIEPCETIKFFMSFSPINLLKK